MSPICHACQLGKSTRLSFSMSLSCTYAPFDIIHADLWTSPVLSVTNYKYYLLLLDDFTHYVWVFLLRTKSEVFSKFLTFCALVHSQFKCEIKSFSM